MSMERWIGGIDAKLQNISDKIGRIEGHLEKLNDRTGDGEHSCVFLNNNECIIYPARPKVCKDFGEDDCKKLKTEIGGF